MAIRTAGPLPPGVFQMEELRKHSVVAQMDLEERELRTSQEERAFPVKE